MSALSPAWHGLATLAAPGLRLMLRRRVARGKEEPARLAERRGIDATPRPAGRLIWLHAASVGEAVSLLPVLDALRSSGAALLVTTGTVTSAAVVAQRAPYVLHRYVPLDVPAWVARFLDHWRPDAAALLESELWPNMLAACQARRLPLMLLNARMSARSQRGWSRAPGLIRQMLGSFAQVWAQSDADAERLRALGAQNVSSPGNLKFAADPLPADAAELARLQQVLGSRPRWLAASTHDGEEAIAAEVHARLAPQHPGLLTVIAPRHPARGPALAASLHARARSAGQDPPAEAGLWLADTMGELGLLYRLCPVVFVGKSLVPGGGQNPLEPARLGCAIAAGPGMSNHAGAVAMLARAGGLVTVVDTAALAAWVDYSLRTPGLGTAQAAANAATGLPAQAAAALLAMA